MNLLWLFLLGAEFGLELPGAARFARSAGEIQLVPVSDSLQFADSQPAVLGGSFSSGVAAKL